VDRTGAEWHACTGSFCLCRATSHVLRSCSTKPNMQPATAAYNIFWPPSVTLLKVRVGQCQSIPVVPNQLHTKHPCCCHTLAASSVAPSSSKAKL
jgi:hypothetical protein